jgi:hypothetical protein
MFAPLVVAPGEFINQKITNIGYGWIAVMFVMILGQFVILLNTDI